MAIPPDDRSPLTSASPTPQQYILMPKRRDRGSRLGARHASKADVFLRQYWDVTSTGPSKQVGLTDLLQKLSPVPGPVLPDLPAAMIQASMLVVDSIHEDGPKLVEVSEDAARAVADLQNEVELRPVLYYRPSVAPRLTPTVPPKASALRLRVSCVNTGVPVAGARITVFTDFANAVGATGETDAAGTVALPLGSSPCLTERVYIKPPVSGGFWGHYAWGVTLNDQDTLFLNPVNASSPDGLAYFRRRSVGPGDGASVKVAIIDSGVGPSPDIVVAGGSNTVRGEPQAVNQDNGSGHGTHVAGIIGSRGVASGIRGLAPDAELYSWRIYDQANNPASNYSIIKAIIYALDDNCDIINLSLGLDAARTKIDLALADAIEDAVDNGAVVIAAAGNDWQDPALFPARMDKVVGVTASGRHGTFPLGSYQECEVDARTGTDPNDFFAAFSNIGTSDQNSEIDLIAAGVGILSSTPNGGCIPMSGTSMACAAVSGVAARLLSHHIGVMSMPRDANRSAAIRGLMNGAVRSLGFGYRYEGSGLIA